MVQLSVAQSNKNFEDEPNQKPQELDQKPHTALCNDIRYA